MDSSITKHISLSSCFNPLSSLMIIYNLYCPQSYFVLVIPAQKNKNILKNQNPTWSLNSLFQLSESNPLVNPFYEVMDAVQKTIEAGS